LSGRGLCDELITRPEESYRLCCVVVCDLETSRIGAPYIYDISRLRVKNTTSFFGGSHKFFEDFLFSRVVLGPNTCEKQGVTVFRMVQCW